MNNHLEFHYVVSYREGYGWNIASDVENAVMSDGTIYDHESQQWAVFNDEIEVLDLDHFHALHSALNQMNGEYNA